MKRGVGSRLTALGLMALAVGACHRQVSKPELPRPQANTHAPAARIPQGQNNHRDTDSGPAIAPDISAIPEPVPQAEPLAAFGNKSPYSVLGRTYYVLPTNKNYVERGIASWYGEKFHGRLTSSHEPYDMYAYTAAHKTLPLPTYARVTNLDNGSSVVVKINDRGPFHEDRILDLSYVAAVKLGIHANGTGRVEVRAIDAGGDDAREHAAEALAAQQRARPAPAPRPAAPLSPLPAQPAAAPASSAPAVPINAARATSAAGDFASARVRSGAWYVQVGAFSDRDNAVKLKDRLESAHFKDVELDRGMSGLRMITRVRIGPFDGDRAGEEVIAALARIGVKAVLVQAD